MSNNSDLMSRLQHKQQQDRQQIEQLTTSELHKLARDLSAASLSALNTTLSDIESVLVTRSQQITQQIEQQTAPLRTTLDELERQSMSLSRMTAQSWLKPALIGLSLLLGISAGCWGMMLILSQQIESKLNQLSQLSQEIESQAQQLAKIESKTWGLVYRETVDGRWIEIPKGYDLKAGWTVGEKKVVKFGKE